MTIEWNDGLHKLGITSIDNQHRELFSLHGDLETFDENNPPRDYLLILKRLYSYTNYHFCTEENLFGKFNFPEAPQHIKMHRAFTARVKKEFEAMKAGLLNTGLLPILSDAGLRRISRSKIGNMPKTEPLQRPAVRTIRILRQGPPRFGRDGSSASISRRLIISIRSLSSSSSR